MRQAVCWRRLPIQAAWEQMVAAARYAVHHAASAATLTRTLEDLETRLLEFAQDYDTRPERLFEALLAVFERRAGRTEEPLDREDIRLLDLLLAALSAAWF